MYDGKVDVVASVIRAGEQARIHPHLAAIDLADHLDEAKRVVAEARRQAEGILDDARAEARRVYAEKRESGYEQGFEAGAREGRQAGFAAAQEEASREFTQAQVDLVADMRRVVDEIDAIKTDLQLAAQERMLDFAVRLAKRLTFDIGRLNTQSASANLQRALDILGSRVDLTIHAHPQDITALRTFAQGLADHVAASGSVRFVEDSAIAPGGCLVRSASSEVDASLETQVAELSALLLGADSDAAASNDALKPVVDS